MRLPDLLATRRGRLAAFFSLYITEGIPLGFAATAVAAQLRRQGVGPAEIGAFVASFYLPWAFKWAFGPFVDVFRSQRWGHRRGWILLTQMAMVATLLMLIPIPLPESLGLFTAILLVHNTFGAIQDVAIDSLACNTLAEHERGLANGLMFAGASVGQAIGGSGVLFLMAYTGFQGSFVLVAAAITAVTLLVVLPMREALAPATAPPAAGGRGALLRAAGTEMRGFAVQAFQSFLGTRGAFRGLFFTLLPAGAMSLGLALQSNLAVEFGMPDDALGALNLWTSIISAAAMVWGGWLSDRWGRRRTLAVYLAGMSLPVLYLLWVLRQHGYDMPRAPGGAPLPALITGLWIASLSYAVFQGLMYGTRAAIMMDVTNPRVAATQFTAYMAMMNLAIAFAATWQGAAVEAWGYQVTLIVDAITGPLCVLLLPAMTRSDIFTDAHAPTRARRLALALGLACLSWLLVLPNEAALGAGRSVAGTFYTLVFVGSALFLLAGREVLGAGFGRGRTLAVWLAVGLLAMYLRKFVPALGGLPLLQALAQALLYAVPLAAGVWLVALSRRDWQAVGLAA